MVPLTDPVTAQDPQKNWRPEQARVTAAPQTNAYSQNVQELLSIGQFNEAQARNPQWWTGDEGGGEEEEEEEEKQQALGGC